MVDASLIERVLVDEDGKSETIDLDQARRMFDGGVEQGEEEWVEDADRSKSASRR